jgi:NAD(P)-dependent dehydrogenase (short-subunit alcohol dehydrogenase family)
MQSKSTTPSSHEDALRPSAAVFVRCPSLKASFEERFRDRGWRVVPINASWDWSAESEMDCAVIDLGFVCFEADHEDHLIEAREQTLASLVRSFLDGSEGAEDILGLSIVTLSSRDWLGSPADPEKSGAAASVVATSRSLALLYAPRGVAVNTICVLARAKDADGDRPHSLLPGGVSLEGVFDSVLYFADPDNRYVTGQTLNVCGGASLLSSMSV